ncbi:MAG: hypothetical protein AAB366_03185 [Patescibacteria group bacterium]
MEENSPRKKFDYLLSVSITIAGILIGGALIYGAGLKSLEPRNDAAQNNADGLNFEEEVIPSPGVELPVKWRNLGKQLVEAGVIDGQKFEEIYAGREGLSEADKNLLYGEDNGNLVIDSQNSGFVLNLLWALGLGNKNKILEEGPMTDEKFGGAGRFASTGGWTIAKGEAMNHYSKHNFIVLNESQQALVEMVSKNIFRPCCGNSTYFPDCNHGMAMLGLLELMASQNIGEDEMYKIALTVNSYWFPDTYLTIAKYFKNKNVSWDKIDAKEVLGPDYSGASGYQNILSQVEPPEIKGGGGCGI